MDATGFRPQRLPAALRFEAALRLVEGSGSAARRAAQGLIDAGPASGIAFEHAMATIDPKRRSVRELALAIPSPGRSVLVFLSRPEAGQDRPEERAACVRALVEDLASLAGRPFHIAQALPSSAETWAVRALEGAGWAVVGHLAYLRRPLGPDDAPKGGFLRHKSMPLEVPLGVEVEPVAPPAPGTLASDELRAALEQSYRDTLDCPGLCGLRETEDIIASHAAIGRPELAVWSVVRHEGEPAGAVLISCLPEQRCYELVYIGLGPSLRGRGLGGVLLRGAIGQLGARLRQGGYRSGWSLTCAVDKANAPAMRLYERLGFIPFDHRVACVFACTRSFNTQKPRIQADSGEVSE